MRKKKDSVNVSMRLDRETWDRLRNYAEERGQSYTVATERILQKFLDQTLVSADEARQHIVPIEFYIVF